MQPAIKSGALKGIFLGDEHVYFGMKMSYVKLIADLIRTSWPNAIIYMNEAPDGIITTVSASTAANGCEGFPFSNNKIAASDVIQVAIMTYSGTFGTNGIPTVAVSAIVDLQYPN